MSVKMRWVKRLNVWESCVDAYKIVVESFEGKRPLGRPRYRWG